MKRKIHSLLAFGALCASIPFAVKPATIIEVTSASSEGVQVEGWTRTDQSATRVGLEPRTTPFRMVFRGTDVQAGFITLEEGRRLEVRAVHRRAWIPLVQVAAAGSRISLDARGSHLGIHAR